MDRILPLILFLFTLTIFCQNGSSSCEGVEPACSDNNGVKVFSNVIGQPNQGSFGCLVDSPNGAWFYIKVGKTGRLEFKIIQNTEFDSNSNPIGIGIDVDFIAWGPFATPDSNCANLTKTCNTGECPNNLQTPNYYLNNLDGTNIVDCSWSELSQESFTVPNAQQGEFYILLITNWVGDVSTNPGTKGFIKFEQTNFGEVGAGVTDCSIIIGDLGPNQEICEGTKVVLDATPTFGTAVSYKWELDTGSGFNPIANQTNAVLEIEDSVSGTYKVIVENTSGQTSKDEVQINFTVRPTATQPTYINHCSRDGFNTLNLQADKTTEILNELDPTTYEVVYFTSLENATSNLNPLPNPYINTNPNSTEIIYARVHYINNNDCFDVTSFEVKTSNIANLTQEDITIIDEGNTIGVSNNLSIQINNQNIGLGDYEYAIENIDSGLRIPSIGYQDAPFFKELEGGGVYRIIVNDKNGCGTNENFLVSVLQFPKFFTPNFDGVNDRWAIKGATTQFYQGSSIQIFNRFGKLLTEVPIGGEGWDGNHQNQKLPSGNYWYSITLVPTNTARNIINKTGYFSLLRK